MKWYDKQKQIFADKNSNSNSFQTPKEEAYNEEVEESAVFTEIVDDNHSNNTITEEPVFANVQTSNVISAQTAPVFEATTISKGTLLRGNVETDGDLIIRGNIIGDVVCNTNLSVYGTIEGMITCNNAYFDDARIHGDVGCSGSLELTESSVIHGNVEANEMLNGGRIKGDAVISEGARFTQKSAILGNVNANDIEIERGAVIQGNIQIRQEVYFDED